MKIKYTYLGSEPEKPISPSRKRPKFKRHLNKLYVGLGVVFIILGWLLLIRDIFDWFSPQHQKYKNDTFLKGILIPDKLLADEARIKISYGNILIAYKTEQLRRGIDFIPDFMACTSGGSQEYILPLTMRLVNNRIELSMVFKSYINYEIIGEIVYNRWQIHKLKILDFYNDDKSLEIIDPQGNIALSLLFREPNIISIQGYFISPLHTTVVLADGFAPCITNTNPEYRQRISELIPRIVPLHVWRDAKIKYTEIIFK